MHWERKNVNPMLALRNAVCNSRWQEMWQKAVLQQQQALQRSVRVEQQAQALLAVGNPSQMSSPPQSAATSEGISPSSQPTSQEISFPVTPLPPVPVAASPGSSRSSAPRPRLRGTHRDTLRREQHSSHQAKSELTGQSCLCGTPIMQSKGGGRTRHYCSDRCRVRAYRKRETKWISSVRRQVQSSSEQTA